jgi:asparagine synthase (glutamine-hydrolysing)
MAFKGSYHNGRLTFDGPYFESNTCIIVGQTRLDNPQATNSQSGQHHYLADLYNKFGATFFESLLGDFAFALFDKKTKELYLVKDQLGIRPLFYAEENGQLHFASSIPLLKNMLQKPCTLNVEYVKTQLTNYPPAVESTTFNEITRLKPAHFLKVQPKGNTSLQRYWDLTPIDLSAYTDHDQLIEELRETFVEAVKCRLPENAAAGAQLSGGLDSSAIAVLISRCFPKEDFFTYSFALSEEYRKISHSGIDEQGTQNQVIDYARLLRENHRQITSFYYKDIQHQLDIQEQVMGGLADSNCIWQDSLFKKAQEDNVKVLFSGFPGDECVSASGGGFFIDDLRSFNIIKSLKYLNNNPLKLLKRYASFYYRDWFKLHKQKLYKSMQQRNLLRKNLRKKDDRFSEKPRFKLDMKNKITRTHTCLRTESEGLYAAQYGITTVYPLADLRLIQLVYSLPVEMFAPKPYNRAVFRNICKGILPEKVRLQNKFNGAMTLAFADIWQAESMKAYERSFTIDDPLHLYVSKQEILQTNKDDKLFVRLYEIDYFTKKALKEA